MAKLCSRCGRFKCFSKGLCLACWRIVYGKPIARAIVSDTKRTKPANRSKKGQCDDCVYRILRRIFLKLLPVCEMPGCARPSTDVHHKRGRGKWYLIVDTWMALCRQCHARITEHSKEAIENGYSERRNQPIQDQPQVFAEIKIYTEDKQNETK